MQVLLKKGVFKVHLFHVSNEKITIIADGIYIWHSSSMWLGFEILFMTICGIDLGSIPT